MKQDPDIPWTDEMAIEEARVNFGEQPREALEVLCDECFQKVRPELPS